MSVVDDVGVIPGRADRVLLAGIARSGTSWLIRAFARTPGTTHYYEPDNIDATAGLARALIARGDHAGARDILSRAAKEHLNHTEIAAAHSALELAEQAQKAMGESDKFRARLAKDANDHEARFELATALFGGGEREAGIDELLTLFRKDRAWNDEAARKQLVKFFEVMGPADPLTLASRRRLSSLMFS
jgi:putative thioredoxin